MRTFAYDELTDGDPIIVKKSEDDIIEEYFDYWLDQMVKASKITNTNARNLLLTLLRGHCIDDWAVVNHAWIVK